MILWAAALDIESCTTIIAIMMRDIRICIVYVNTLISSPVPIAPPEMRRAPK